MTRDDIERNLDRVLTEFTDGKPGAVTSARSLRVKLAGDMAAATTNGKWLIGNTWDLYPEWCMVAFGVGERADDDQEDADPYWWSQGHITYRDLDPLSETGLYHWFLRYFEAQSQDTGEKNTSINEDRGCV